MINDSTYVGLDVHKETIQVAVILHGQAKVLTRCARSGVACTGSPATARNRVAGEAQAIGTCPHYIAKAQAARSAARPPVSSTSPWETTMVRISHASSMRATERPAAA